jgi:hypothetical protein
VCLYFTLHWLLSVLLRLPSWHGSTGLYLRPRHLGDPGKWPILVANAQGTNGIIPWAGSVGRGRLRTEASLEERTPPSLAPSRADRPSRARGQGCRFVLHLSRNLEPKQHGPERFVQVAVGAHCPEHVPTFASDYPAIIVRHVVKR